MATPLLTTKHFVPPARYAQITRQRLLDRLKEGINFSLVLVSAPAGFGKTTLVSEWVRHMPSPIKTAWLSLEDSDNDPGRFWEYFIAAIQTWQNKAGITAQSYLHSNQTPPIESILTALLNDLAVISEDFVLILDDYHFIKTQSIHDGLIFLLEHLPSQVHLVIATRVDPPLPLAHYRGKGTLLEFGANDLRFTLEEADNLLKELNSPDLSAEQLRALNSRTEGWVVGLKMAFLSLRGEQDISKSIADFTGSQRYIMDYLLEEVLQKQPESVREFLLQTSILGRLNGSLCDAVCATESGGDMLRTLEKANLFIVPLDNSRQWYRYEHLFTELLRHRLELERGKAAAKMLSIKASQWFESQRLLEDAINYALAAQDWERVMRLLLIPEIQAPNWQSLTMYNWTRQIPVEVLRSDREICMLHIYCLWRLGEIDTAEIHLSYLEKTYSQDSQFQGKIAATGKIDLFEEYARKALELLPEDDVDNRGFIAMMLGGNKLNNNLYNEAEPLMTEGYQSMKKVGYVPGAAYPLVWLGVIAAVRGKLNEAEKCYQEALVTAGQNFPGLYIAHLYLGNLLYIWNNLDGAAEEEEKAIKLKGLPMCEAVEEAYLQLASIRLAQGKIAAAEEAITKAEQEFEKVNPVSGPIGQRRCLITGCRLAIAVAREDSAAVSHWLAKFVEWDDRFLSNNCILASHLLHLRWDQEKEERLKVLYVGFRQNGYWYYCFLIRIEQALASSDRKSALSFLSETFNLARREGIVRVFVDYGKVITPILREAISEGIEPEFARKLLEIIESEDGRRQAIKTEKTLTSPSSEMLSEREKEVLRLVESGFSDRQIASKLVISLSTAKTHVHHILEKLESQTRTRAVARAKELKLIN
jgi:LuxR family maltose regulon positive regulatory protein